MRLPSIAIMSLLLAGQLLTSVPSHGFDLFSHRQRTKARTQTESVPGCTGHQLQKYNYTSNTWPFTKDRKFSATVIAVAATDPTIVDRTRKIKPFHFRATSLTVDPLVLDQVGLSLSDSGRLYATGRINHTGGDGGLIGANVTVHVRAYVSHTRDAAPTITRPQATETPTTNTTTIVIPSALTPLTEADELTPQPVAEEEVPIATPNSVTRIPPDAYRVWSSKQKFWVSRGRAQHVTLANKGDSLQALRHHFDEITHLEVELVYERDR